MTDTMNLCDATTSDIYTRIQRQQRDNPDYDRKCARVAKWRINGKCLCSVHAGQEALKKLSRSGQVKRLLQAKP